MIRIWRSCSVSCKGHCLRVTPLLQHIADGSWYTTPHNPTQHSPFPLGAFSADQRSLCAIASETQSEPEKCSLDYDPIQSLFSHSRRAAPAAAAPAAAPGLPRPGAGPTFLTQKLFDTLPSGLTPICYNLPCSFSSSVGPTRLLSSYQGQDEQRESDVSSQEGLADGEEVGVGEEECGRRKVEVEGEKIFQETRDGSTRGEGSEGRLSGATFEEEEAEEDVAGRGAPTFGDSSISAGGGAAADVAATPGDVSLGKLHETMVQLFSEQKYGDATGLFLDWLRANEGKGEGEGGGVPDLSTWHVVLKCMLLQKTEFKAMKSLVDMMEAKGVAPTAETYNILARTALRWNNPVLAVDIMSKMKDKGMIPDASCYNTLISLSSANRHVEQALQQKQMMLDQGMFPSRSVLMDLLLACARTRRTKDALSVLKDIKSRGYTIFPRVLGDVVSASAEEDDADCALAALQVTPDKDVSKTGRLLSPAILDRGTALVALNTAARTGHTKLAEQVWAMMISYLGHVPTDPACHLARIHAYAMKRDLRKVVHSMVEYEGLLKGTRVASGEGTCVVETSEGDKWGAGVDGLDELLNPFTNLRPVTLSLTQNVETLDNAYYLLEERHTKGLPVALSLLNCIIAGCGALRDLHRAKLTFEEMQATLKLTPDVNTYTAMITAYGQEGEGGSAESTFQALKDAGLKPTRQAHIARFEAHIRSFDAPKALEAMNQLVEDGHRPSGNHVIQLLRRSDREQFTAGVRRGLSLIKEYKKRELKPSDGTRRLSLFEGARDALRS